MKAYHIYKSRTAGSHFLFALLICFRPFFCLISGCHVSAKTHIIEIFKSQFLHGFLPACCGDIRAELAFCGRSCHGIDFFAGLQCFHHIHNKGLGADGTKGTAVNAFSAANTFFFVDNGNSMLIICNGIHRTAVFTGTLQVGNGIVRTGLCTFSAFFTFGCINMGAFSAHFNGTEFAGIDTCLSNTVLAVFRNGITGNGTVLTGRADNLNYISVIRNSWRLPFCQADSLPNDFSLLVDTAAELWRGPRYQFQCNVISFCIQFSGKCQFCNFIEHIMFDSNYIFISEHPIYLSLFLFVNILTLYGSSLQEDFPSYFRKYDISPFFTKKNPPDIQEPPQARQPQAETKAFLM